MEIRFDDQEKHHQYNRYDYREDNADLLVAEACSEIHQCEYNGHCDGILQVRLAQDEEQRECKKND